MNKRKAGYLILVAVILLIAGAVVGWLDLPGQLPWQGSHLYEDSQGHFTMKLDPNWEQVETEGSYSQALQKVGCDQGQLSGGGAANIGDWQAYSKEDAAG